MQMRNDQYFTSSDFPLGVTLMTLGFELSLLDRTDPLRVAFCFKRKSSLDDVIQAFWRGDLRVEPKAFFLHQKILKSRIYSKDEITN